MRVSLGVLRDYVSNLLVENRIDDAREKYPDIEEDVFQNLVANQPGGSNNKYLMWSAKQVDDEVMPEEVIMAIRLFHDNVHRLKQKDINQYESVEALDTAIDELQKNKSKSQEAKQAKADTQVIYNDDNWLVVRPYTADASCKYGAGSKWCISATASRNYFNSYSETNNKFYFVIDKKSTSNTPNSKFAIAIVAAGLAAAGREIQVYNASDSLVSLNTVASAVGSKWPEIWEKIQAHVAANPKTREVEDAERATEEHVAALLKGEKLSDQAMKKVAKSGKLSNQVIKKILGRYENYTGPTDYRDERQDIMNSLSSRASEMESEGAMAVLKWISENSANSYWRTSYLERMLAAAPFKPEDFREIAKTNDEEILANIFSNPATPDDVKRVISDAAMRFVSESATRKVYWELIKSGAITKEQMAHAMEMDNKRGSYRYLTSQILNHPEDVRMEPELVKMLTINNAGEFKNLLRIPNVPHDFAVKILSKLMSSESLKKYDMLELLRTTPLGPKQIEKLWADWPQATVRTALLQNPGIGEGNANKFAKSKNSAYRFSVAHNTITPVDALNTLSKDESVSTRSAVAANPKTSPETLYTLAKDQAVAVRASVASNASSPTNLVRALKRDSDDFVRKAARKTLKALDVTEAYIGMAMGMRGLLVEELTDDDVTPDIMNPSWRDIIPSTIDKEEFVAVFLLQNNGSATREEITKAYKDWMGSAGGAGELWKTNKWSDQIIRGIMSQGKGWFWSPPGINKGALFRLTPAGASAALDIIRKLAHLTNLSSPVQITSAKARPGKTYFVKGAEEALDVTGMEKGDLEVEEVAANYNNEPIKTDGKYTKLSPNRSWRQKRRQRSVKMFKYTSPTGEVKYTRELPKVSVPNNAKVQFIKTFHGQATNDRYSTSEPNRAIVKYNDKYLLVKFPMWAKEGGAVPDNSEKETNVPPPVRKSPPPRELTGEPAAAPARTGGGEAPAAPRGPKVGYKIYGRHRGAPAHTRLKGQAYAAPTDTQFSPGEQATIQVGADGKLKVKKVAGDHEQTWDPVEG